MIVQSTVLPNGLRLITRPISEAQSVTVCFFVGAGGRYEDLDREYGASHFLEHLLFKGTRKRPSPRIISEEIDSVGGFINAYTAEDHVCFYVKLPKAYLGLGINILSDMLTDPLFDKSEFERERDVVLEEMKVFKDDPARHVFDLVGDTLWPEDNLRTNVIGTEESITSMRIETVKDFFNSLYCYDNMVVAIAGAVEHEKASDWLIGALPPSRNKANRTWQRINGGLSRKIVNLGAQETNQSHIVVSGRGPQIDAIDEGPMKVLCTLLGTGMSSRLFLNVREAKGLAYHIYMSANNFVDSGKFEIYAGVNNDKISEAISAIVDELKNVRELEISEKELAKAREQVRGRMIMSIESNSSLADLMGSQMLLTGRPWSLEESLAKIDAVTTEQLQKAAIEYFQPKSLRMSVIGPYNQSDCETFQKILQSSK